MRFTHLRGTAIAALAAALAAALLLAACGGGDGGGAGNEGGGGMPAEPPPVAGSEVPLAATQSAGAAFAFVAATAAARSDSADPLRVGDATLATSETDEPQPL